MATKKPARKPRPPAEPERQARTPTSVRLSEDELQLIQQACDLQSEMVGTEVTVGVFLRASALQRAKELLNTR